MEDILWHEFLKETYKITYEEYKEFPISLQLGIYWLFINKFKDKISH